MGRTTSPDRMTSPAFLQASGKTTSQKLLQQCLDYQKDKPGLLKRSFHQVVSGETSPPPRGPGESRDDVIRVMQWNVLADALSSGADNFVKCPNEVLEWGRRQVSCLQEILRYDPDVVLLQEVDHYQDFYRPQLGRVGYEGVFKAKPDSPCLYYLQNNGPDGCAAFYKTSKFSLVGGRGGGAACPVLRAREPDGSTQPTNQVAVLLRLRCAATATAAAAAAGEEPAGREFLVGTTHLKAKPSWHRLRHLQGLDLLDAVRRQARGSPVLLGGDFNAVPGEAVYGAFAGSDLALESVGKSLSPDGRAEPAYTTWKIRPAGEACHTIDYLWYSRRGLRPVRVLGLPDEEEVGKDRLPSHRYPSDHLSLVADFTFKSP